MTDLNVHTTVEITPVGGKPQTWDSFSQPFLFTRVRVELTTGQASQAEVSVFDPEFKFLNRYTTKDGVLKATVRVWLGYGGNLGEPLMKGILARVERSRRDTTFRVYDMGYQMRLVQKTGYHRGADLDIMRRLVTRNTTPEGKPLKFVGPDAGFRPITVNSTIHDQRTDWDFLSELAREAGLVLWVRDDTVFAKEPAQIGIPVESFEYGTDVLLASDYDLSYKLPENVAGTPRLVSQRGRGRGGHRLEGESSKGQRGQEIVVLKRDLRNHTRAEANRRAQAIRELERENTFECRIKHLRPLAARRVDVRDTVEILNLGDLFSGSYLVDSVSYEVSSRGLSTSYNLYRK